MTDTDEEYEENIEENIISIYDNFGCSTFRTT